MNNEPVLATLGELIVIWNTFEDAMGLLLKPLIGQGTALDAIVAELGPVTLCNAIRAAASVTVPEDMQNYIGHIVEGFERHREYRNYYVHGVRDTTGHGYDGHAQIKQITGKGKLRVFEDKISARAVSRLNSTIAEWTLCALAISFQIPSARAGALYTLPDKLPLPDRLQKRPQSQQSPFLPPQS